MNLTYRHAQEFVGQVRPMLEACQTATLIRYLSKDWPPGRLIGLLYCGDSDARNTALVCLAMTGTMAESAPIAGLLHDERADTTGFAEQALWSIWFRASDDHSNRTLNLAVQLIERNEYEAAIEWLSILALRQPRFAEVFNQRAIARFLTDRYAAAIAVAKSTAHAAASKCRRIAPG